ncbi:hypothetical protein M199_gp071 [Halogranum tailed virus 1]|uniref:Uncharacterized protein n=1 Tax=Halogranum tailed virus 1 TaxID=1273749 RepID=R4T9J0_9CAUD|nr:hypothetical protein M199_gp071 [Halogranum tailed virus 1]AGM11595.1 hypothetical protein HGTV1_298 [Halogranum tailed virus 1]
MARELGRLKVATFCQSCGFVKGHPAGEGVNRCTDCGRFTSDDPDVCCTIHELRKSPYPSGECPYCEMERDRQAQMMHEMTRDPTVEPW